MTVRSANISAAAADDLVRLALADGDGVIGLAEMIFAPGGGSCRSIRISADELIRVSTGQLSVWCGTERFDLCPGDAILVPHGTPRTVVNVADADARAITVVVPVGVTNRTVRRRSLPALVQRGATPVHAAA